jgi:hypothetical protein
MLAVHRRGDPVEVGWAAAVMTNELLRTAWAVNDLPNPSLDLGTVQRHLDDLLDVFETHLSASIPPRQSTITRERGRR